MSLLLSFESNKDFAEKQDKIDRLASFRNEFYIPKYNNQDSIYLCGNSLGLQPKRVKTALDLVTEDWKEYGVEAHMKAKYAWVNYHEHLKESSAKIVGAKLIEVTIMNTLTVNLHLMMISFYKPTKERFKIIVEAGSFPSDRYAFISQILFHGLDPSTTLIEIAPREGESYIRDEDILETIQREGDQVALVLFSGINYYTGQVFEMQKIVEQARKIGANVGFDLAHAAGNVELKLHDWDVDFAVWCNYKYINGGPGTLSGCFVHEKHANNNELPRLAGWFGNKMSSRFAMKPDFDPTEGADGWIMSNPPIYALAPLRASLEIFEEAGFENCVTKSKNLTRYLRFLIENKKYKDISIITPAFAQGCQLSLFVNRNGGKIVFNHLTETGVICDWREPNVIRIAPVPLYNSFMDVFRFVEILSQLVS